MELGGKRIQPATAGSDRRLSSEFLKLWGIGIPWQGVVAVNRLQGKAHVHRKNNKMMGKWFPSTRNVQY